MVSADNPHSGIVFPAYAGVSRLSPARCLRQMGIPRLCGGEPASITGLVGVQEYSPPMRG